MTFREPSLFMFVLGWGVAHEMKWVCDVIMWSMQTRIGKLFSYSILYSHSSPNSAKVESTEGELFLVLYTYRNPDIYHPQYELFKQYRALNTRRVGRIRDSYANPRRSRQPSPNPPSTKMRLCKHGKKCSIVFLNNSQKYAQI